MDQTIAEKLDKLIEILSRPALPADKMLWDAAAVGAYLGVSARQVAERYALRPGFPATIRLPSESGRGLLRWRAAEVIAWAERQTSVPRSSRKPWKAA